MKIWVKIAILVFVVTNIVLEVVLFYIRKEIKEEYTKLEGQNLQTLVASISNSIDGEYFNMVDFTDIPNIYKDTHYLSLQNSLKNIKNELNLSEEIYSLTRIDSNKAIFGIMTNTKPFSGDTLNLISDIAKNYINDVYRTKKSTHTDIYEDQYGTWISGIAPIFDNKGNVVALLQADHTLNYIQSKIEENNTRIIYFRLMLIPFLILISILASKLISRPITKVTKMIENISRGNYNGGNGITAGGEIKLLVNATKNMRETILEQQDKIKETIRQLTDSNEKLKVAKERAEELNRLKSNFLANMSHELRTPLVGTLGFVEILNNEIKDPELNKMTNFILEDQQRLLITLNSLLDISAIEANKKPVNLEPLNLIELVQNTFIRYKAAAQLKDLEFEFIIKNKDLTINADKKLFIKALNNLVDNAIKFTKKGFVKIEIDKFEIGIEKYGMVKVIDSGIGIPQDCKDFIFEEFRQISEGLSRNFEGVGLGLTIAKSFIELMNGKIEVQSNLNEGSVFSILLPFNM